jgi:type I restriction enzyme S subunit
MSKTNLTPDIRFPEFQNEGKWEDNSLRDVCEVTNGKANAQDHVEEGKYPLFDRSEVIKASNEFIFDCEAVIIPGEGMRFIPKHYNGKFNLHQRAYALKDFNCSGKFVYYSMLHRSDLLSQKAVRSTVLSLRLPILQDFPIEVPSNPKEQQKIASCLSSLDEVIAAHSQKLDVLKEHKKGLMQNLFPQEGAKVPKYRFKEFEKDWEKVKLKEVSTYFNGGSYENDVKEEGKYELITLKSINTSGNLICSKRYIDIEVPTLAKGTLIMILSEQAPGLLGMTTIIPTENKYVLNQRIAEIRPNQKVESFFLSMAINRNQAYFSKQGAGMKVQNITKPNVENYEFLIPEIPEQQKIASCLSSLDALITAQAEKIEQLKLHKKGLMQGLFPRINN